MDEGIKLLKDTIQYDMFVNNWELKDDSTGVSFEIAILYFLIKCSVRNPIDRIDGIKEKIQAERTDDLRSSVDYGIYLCIELNPSNS